MARFHCPGDIRATLSLDAGFTMLRQRLLLLSIAALATAPLAAQEFAADKAKWPALPKSFPTGLVPISMETALGTIEAVLDSVHAPVTVSNFLRYVDASLYEGARFHRTVTPANQPGSPVRIEVIQGSLAPERAARRFAPILLERTTVTGLHHSDGTLSVARAGPDTGADEFFICIGNQPELDFGGKRNPDGQGFAAFGQVTRGMDVVRRIQMSRANGQQLDPPVVILRVTRKR